MYTIVIICKVHILADGMRTVTTQLLRMHVCRTGLPVHKRPKLAWSHHQLIWTSEITSSSLCLLLFMYANDHEMFTAYETYQTMRLPNSNLLSAFFQTIFLIHLHPGSGTMDPTSRCRPTPTPCRNPRQLIQRLRGADPTARKTWLTEGSWPKKMKVMKL